MVYMLFLAMCTVVAVTSKLVNYKLLVLFFLFIVFTLCLIVLLHTNS